MSDIFELEMPTLAQMIRAETGIGQGRTPAQILRAAEELAGRAPPADVVIAALLHLAAIRNDTELAAFVVRLDEMLTG